MYNVHFIVDAERDLFDVYRYSANTISPKSAEDLLRELEEACLSLETLAQSRTLSS